MHRQHHYQTSLTWTGNTGQGTSGYKAYERAHALTVEGKPEIPASSDPSFRGDPARYNPEELLVASLSSCHMLWYLHLCAVAGVVVTAYEDRATGTMTETADGGGEFTEVTLHPRVTVRDASMIDEANALHHKANALCFIARSVNFPVKHEPVCSAEHHS
ncbi:MAG TPA: OsmC family protein [Chitinophagaceae bacterium]|nr:OsmC family protein [Chitinophagaceae bacterium]